MDDNKDQEDNRDPNMPQGVGGHSSPIHNHHRKKKSRAKKAKKKAKKKAGKSATKVIGSFVIANAGWVAVGVAIFVAVLMVIMMIVSMLGSDGSCSGNNDTSSYSSDIKVTALNRGQKDVVEGIEKWGIHNHFSASQIAGILANGLAESSLSSSTNGGNYLGISYGNVGSSSDGVVNSYDYMNHFDKVAANSPTDKPYWAKFKKMQKSSPFDCGYYYADKIVRPTIPGNPQYTIDSAKSRGNTAKSFYHQLASGGSSSNVTVSDTTADSGDDSSNDCNSNNNDTDSEDGTGSVKEHPYTAYRPGEVPSDMKPYIHDPSKMGLKYKSASGWFLADDPGQCVEFSESYFPLIWGVKPMSIGGNGHDMAQGYSQKMKGKLSGSVSNANDPGTPHAGAVASTNNSQFTTDTTYGHTFVVDHVLKNGDFIIAEENWPDKSGVDKGSPGVHTWNYALIPKSMNKYTEYFMPDTSKYHLKWT